MGWLRIVPTFLLTFPATAMAADSGTVGGGFSKEGLAQMAKNVLDDLGGSDGPFITLFLALMVFAGLVMMITGIYGLTRRDTPKGGAIVAILVGTLLISLDQTISMLNMTIFDKSAAYSILNSDVGSAGSADKISYTVRIFINFAVFIVQVVGFCALYRGLKTISDISLTHQRQPEQSRAAWIFIIMGILCINILWTLEMISATVGGEAQEYYNLMFKHIKQ